MIYCLRTIYNYYLPHQNKKLLIRSKIFIPPCPSYLKHALVVTAAAEVACPGVMDQRTERKLVAIGFPRLEQLNRPHPHRGKPCRDRGTATEKPHFPMAEEISLQP